MTANALAQYGLNIADLNRILNTALAGGKAGTVYEGERRSTWWCAWPDT
jgi:cobalt-zinc-cadmium resistance protein CzcA